MTKQEMISDVMEKLSSIGIIAVEGVTADIAVNQEFVDAGWSTGKKKIEYQASALFLEKDNTVYLWELTKETGSGISFGFDGDSETQFGKTLFRKMKSVQYGPEGKAYEFDLDLGAIPKIFKDIAKLNGWKFKQALKKQKASYPPGKPSVIPPPPIIQLTAQTPQTPSEPAPDEIKTKVKKVGTLLFPYIFILLALVTLVFMLIGKNSTVGWILTAALLLCYFIYGRGAAKKSCLLQILLFLAVGVIILIIFTYTANI